MNDNRPIIIPEKINQEAIKSVADGMAASFIPDMKQLQAVLSMFGVETVEHLLTILSNFFLSRFRNSKLTPGDIEKLDLQKLAYEFLKETGFQKPEFETEEQRGQVINVMCKLGRIYLHEILFPELIAANPNAALSTLNLLKRTVTKIAIAEKFDKRLGSEALMLDEIEIPFPEALPPVKATKNLPKYLMPGDISAEDIAHIAGVLYSKHLAIRKKSAFIKLLNSKGGDFEPMEIDSEHEKLIAHLFYCMYNPYTQGKKPLIKMSFGKGYMDFLYQNIVTETGNFTGTKTKNLDNKVRTQTGHDDIKRIVKQILDPIYDKQNK
jgi:hypothetical protein